MQKKIFQDIGCAPDILTMNMTHTGELGYVFYIPTEFALHVYDELVEAGKVSFVFSFVPTGLFENKIWLTKRLIKDCITLDSLVCRAPLQLVTAFPI